MLSNNSTWYERVKVLIWFFFNEQNLHIGNWLASRICKEALYG